VAREVAHRGGEDTIIVLARLVIQSSLLRANGRSFDCDSRGEAARGFAQDDNFYCQLLLSAMTVVGKVRISRYL
jgi:hypothetical protein